MSEGELLDALRACEDLNARAAAVQARLTRRPDTMVGARHQEIGVPAARRGRDLAGLVALARRESPARAQRQAGFARALTAMDSVSRAFPQGLGLFLTLRDRVCRTPYCDSAIRHDDHVEAHADGGETSADNGQGLCEYCDYAKQAPGWTAQAVGEDPGQVHQVETTLPTGHRVRSRAPAAPRPSPHVDRSCASRPAPRAIALEIYRHLPVIEIDYRLDA